MSDEITFHSAMRDGVRRAVYQRDPSEPAIGPFLERYNALPDAEVHLKMPPVSYQISTATKLQEEDFAASQILAAVADPNDPEQTHLLIRGRKEPVVSPFPLQLIVTALNIAGTVSEAAEFLDSLKRKTEPALSSTRVAKNIVFVGYMNPAGHVVYFTEGSEFIRPAENYEFNIQGIPDLSTQSLKETGVRFTAREPIQGIAIGDITCIRCDEVGDNVRIVTDHGATTTNYTGTIFQAERELKGTNSAAAQRHRQGGSYSTPRHQFTAVP